MDLPVPYKGKDPYIFISYSHRNSEQALEIISVLQEYKFRVWYDDGIHPGTEWDDDIAQHVTECTWFVALISQDYLDSENCRDELFYARELKKNRLLIYLEDVELPAAMAMRMNRLQAIYWNRYQTSRDAMAKFLETENVEACQDLEALKAQQAEREAARKAEHEEKRKAMEEVARRKQEAARKDELEAQARALAEAARKVEQEAAQRAEEAKRAQKHDPESAAEEQPPVPEPAEQHSKPEKPRQKRKPGKKVLIAVIAAAVVIAACIAIAVVSGSGGTGNSSASSSVWPSVSPAALQSASNTSMPDSAEAGTEESEDAYYQASLLWGSHAYNSDVEAYLEDSSTDYQQMAMPGGDTYEMTLLPMQIVAAPDYPGYLLITFVDRYAVSYSFYGSYTLEGTALQISTGAPEDLDAALACWGAEDASPLEKTLDYQFELDSGRYKIKTDSGDYVYLLPEGEVTDRVVTLNGSASDSSHLYREIAGMNVTINKDTLSCDSDPVVMFADGGHTTDASMTSQWLTIGAINLSWTIEERPYNGRTEDFDVDKTVNINYYSTAPYGFVLVGDSDVFYYQSTAEVEVDESGDSISTSPLPAAGSGSAPSKYIIKTVSASSGTVALRNEKSEDPPEILDWISNGSTVWVVDNTDNTYWYVYVPDAECYGYVHSYSLE